MISQARSNVNPNTDHEDNRKQQQKEREENQTLELREIAKDAEIFTDTSDKMYARVTVNGHHKTLSISLKEGKIGGRFKYWLRSEYAKLHNGKQPNGRTLDTFVQGVVSVAMFNEDTREVFLRVGHKDGKVYLDLANKEGQVVEIDEIGWRILDDSPVMFRRSNGMLPLPRPVEGGKIDELRQFLNVSDKDWILAVAWLLSTLHPTGPYPIFVLQGDAGAGKSTAIKYLRNLVDANRTVYYKGIRDATEVHVKANGTWILALDNMSSMPQWLSDVLCALSTGLGNAVKTLYEDEELTVFFAKRPTSVNGIEELATAGDLIDRAVIVELKRISDEDRREEKELDAAYEEARPRIMGAIFDVISYALRNRKNVTLKEKPRMADFAMWVVAAEEKLGWGKGAFMQAYKQNKIDAADVEINASSVGRAIVDLMKDRANKKPDWWLGNATKLETDIREYAKSNDPNGNLPPSWPKQPNRMSGALKRIKGALESKGIHVDDSHRTKGTRMILIWTGDTRPGQGDDQSVKSDDHDDNPKSTVTSSPRSKSRLTGRGDDSDDKMTHSIYSFSNSERKEEYILQSTVTTVTESRQSASHAGESGDDAGDDTYDSTVTDENVPSPEEDEVFPWQRTYATQDGDGWEGDEELDNYPF